MFYKLEISYEDYFLVKQNSITKQEYLEHILENIKEANSIELVKTNNVNFEGNRLYDIDFKLKKIKVFANEFVLLSALLELDNFQIYLKEKYNLIRNSMPYLLNMAYDMENVEVIRDFNAWSWNTSVNDISDININLIYQNLKIALNTNIFTKIQKENISDVVQTIEESLLQKYNKDIVEKFISLIFKLSILIYIVKSDNERKRLLEEKETIKLELDEINDKKIYIENISIQKRKLTQALKKIDLTINNQELLLEEYKRRNEELPEYNKIFSLSHLAEKMQKERQKILAKINLCNKRIEPKTYLASKNKLQKDYMLLDGVDFDKENDIYKYIDELQELFIKDIFVNKIENSNTKEELINCLYELRYYNFLPYKNDKVIRDLEYIKQYIEKAKETLIKKLYDNKIINTLSTSEKNDIEIVKSIFDLKIIDMENIYIQIKESNDKYNISVYDEKETQEKEFEMNLKFNSKDKIKLNKKVRLFKYER